MKITSENLELIHELSSREYSGNSMHNNSTEKERELFKGFRAELKTIAIYYKDKYDKDFGVFNANASSGNPIKIGGKKINKVWSGIYKGAKNKQYASQISFVIDERNKCLDIGFYFGRASSRTSIEIDRLYFLANTLSNSVLKDNILFNKFEELIDFGFKTSIKNERIDHKEWLEKIKNNPENSQIVYKLHQNEQGDIDKKSMDLCVSMLMFLMAVVPSEETNIINKKKKKSLTPEERAKQAERLSLIGLKGEEYVYEQEILKLKTLGLYQENLVQHVSLESDSYGYDILSCDENLKPIKIEVKTTTRKKGDYGADQFYFSGNEYRTYNRNKDTYKVYRVFDIEGADRKIEKINLDESEISVDSYIVKI